MCVCNLRYPACNAHVPYFHLRPVQLYNIFGHYLINSTIFGGKKYTERKICVLIFVQILCEALLTLRIIQRDIVINVRRSSYKVAVMLVIY